MKEILLENILHLNTLEGKIKVRFNQDSRYEKAKDVYKANPDEFNNKWLFWRKNKRYFNIGDIAVCFLKFGNDEWLLTTVKRVTKELDVKSGINYEGEELEEIKPYFGRVIVTYHKKRTQDYYYEKFENKFIVKEILPYAYSEEDI